MGIYLDLLRLRDISAHNSLGIIRKGKKYIKPGQKAPKGVQLHKGPKGGTYYIIEDKHTKFAGKHHELVRSKGVTKDQWDEIRQKLMSEGAESVEFLPQPEYGGIKGKKLYNIYVRRGDTDEKIESKIKVDKDKFAQRKKKAMKKDLEKFLATNPDGLEDSIKARTKEPEWELSEDIFTNRKKAWDDEQFYQNKGYKTKIIEGKNENGKRTYQVHYQKPAPATNVKDYLVQIGGKYWRSNDGSKERVYIPHETFHTMIGLELQFFGTGNISSAKLKGKPISNNKARNIHFGINPYYDLNENKFSGVNPDWVDELNTHLEPYEKYTPSKANAHKEAKKPISMGWVKELAEGESPMGKDANRLEFQNYATNIHDSLMLHTYKKESEIPAQYHIKPGYDTGKIQVYNSFSIKDKLKSKGFKWDPYTKLWEKSVKVSDIQNESKFLSESGVTSFRFDNAPDVRNFIINELKPEGGSWGKFYDKHQEQAMDKLNEQVESIKKKFGLFQKNSERRTRTP
jgi:hypothetical protein